MVKKIKRFFQCEECKLFYKNKKQAQICEKWCKKYKSCNLEITKHAIRNMGLKLKDE